MSLRERAWGGAVAAAARLAPAAGLLRPALSGAIEARRGAASALERWGAQARDPARPLLWLHGASAGELLGAAPVVRAVREESDAQLVVTHFSPSGAAAAAALEPDLAGLPPLDTAAECRRALDAVLPSALLFARGDVWPNLTRAARSAGVPRGMVNGTVDPGSSRLRPPARWLLRPAYRRLGLVGAASGEDARRLEALGVRAAALRVTGDAAFDLALERVDRPPRAGAAARHRLAALPRAGGLRLVAGSTGPDDEAVLVEAAARLAARGRRLDLILVPHEPTPAAVEALAERCARRLGRRPARWSDAGVASSGVAPAAGRAGEGDAGVGGGEGGTGDGRVAGGHVLIVDVVGVLAHLYPEGDAAWVGGGFGGDGLHSVVEPAAAAVPVLFGPRHDRREARELLDRGGARVVTPEGAVAALEWLMDREEVRREMGRRAREYVETGRGAAAAGAELALELMGLRPPRA